MLLGSLSSTLGSLLNTEILGKKGILIIKGLLRNQRLALNPKPLNPEPLNPKPLNPKP